MTDLIFEFVATPTNPIPSSLDGIDPPGALLDLSHVDPRQLSPWRWTEVVHDLPSIELRLVDRVSMEQPVTACQIAHAMHLALPLVEQTIDRCQGDASYHALKRWVDMSRQGQGRTFVGTCGHIGLDEPSAPTTDDGSLPEVDPRTALAIIRRDKAIELPKLATRLGVTLDVTTAVVAQLASEGHVQARKRGKTITAYPIVWPDQQPKRPKAKAARRGRMPG